MRGYDLASDLQAAASVRPDEYAAGAVNGAGVDCRAALAVLWVLDIGDAEGTPTSFTVDVAIQDSDDNSAFAAAKDEANANIAIAQQVAVNTVAELLDKLHANAKAGNRPSKRYRRAVATVAFVGGTSPNVALACHALVLKRILPSA